MAFVFATRIFQFALGVATVFLIGRLLGAAPSGDYALLLTWVGMLVAIGQMGMPVAMTYMVGRGKTLVSLERVGLVLTVALSVAIVVPAIVALPVLETSVLRALGGRSDTSMDLLRLVLVAVPCQFLTQFSAGVLYTCGHNRVFNVIQVVQAATMLFLTLALIGIAPFGVTGAVVAYLAASVGGSVAAAVQVHGLVRGPEGSVGEQVTIGEFARYGIRLYPQSVTAFFSYRADVFLLSWMLGNPMLIGYYSIAVRIAEMTFYVPDAIGAMLYPAIATSNKQEADRFAPAVARLTMLATVALAAAMIPAGFVAIWVILPDFKPAFPAVVVLMPGIISMSLAKVLSSYVSGLGRPTPTAVASTIALATNLAANLILIPRFGIVGASASSLISYTSQATMLLFVASRLAGVSPLAFILPGRAEVDRIWRMASDLRRRVGPRGDAA